MSAISSEAKILDRFELGIGVQAVPSRRTPTRSSAKILFNIIDLQDRSIQKGYASKFKV
jgi:hypothetical protein